MIENNPELMNAKLSQSKRTWFSEEQRNKHFQDYKKSGLSVKDYCQLNSISPSALYKWIGQFTSKPSFMPVHHEMAISDLNKQSFEIIFSSGLRIRFPELTHISVIKQLIREIESCNLK